MYDTPSLQRRNILNFQKSRADLGFISKSPGLHGEGFSPILNNGVKFASMIEEKVCTGKQ